MDMELFEDPFEWFDTWMTLATQRVASDPNAVALGTVDALGNPSVRMVLLKQWDRRGFVFYTNYESRKGQALLQTRKAAMTLHWRALERQVRIEGVIEEVEPEVADAYFDSRSRDSRIGAWASHQSSVLESRQALVERVAYYEHMFEGKDHIPRPPHWSGFRLKPLMIEFWAAGDARIHDRVAFSRDYIHQPWTRQRLNP